MKSFLFASLILPFLITYATTIPNSITPRTALHIPLHRRSKPPVKNLESFLRKAAKTEARYGVQSGIVGEAGMRKRAGEVILTNQNDS